MLMFALRRAAQSIWRVPRAFVGARDLTLRRSAARSSVCSCAGRLFRLGNAFAAVALPWLVLDLSGSGLWAGAIASASLIALVIGAFFGGALIDRHGARRVAIIAGLASAVCVGAVPAIVQLGPEALPFIAVLVAAGALLDSPGMTARDNRICRNWRGLARSRWRVPFRSSRVDRQCVPSWPVRPLLVSLSALAVRSVALVIAFTCSMLSALLIAVWLPGGGARRTKRNDGGMLSAFGFRFRAPPLAVSDVACHGGGGCLTSTDYERLLPSLFDGEAARAPQEFGLAASSIGAGSALRCLSAADDLSKAGRAVHCTSRDCRVDWQWCRWRFFRLSQPSSRWPSSMGFGWPLWVSP